VSREDLNKTYLYHDGNWVELPRDDMIQEILEGRESPAPSPAWYASLGYYPRPVMFKAPGGLAEVEVYTQSSDNDEADYTFMYNVSVAGAIHRVFVNGTPSLIKLINEIGPAIQFSHSSEKAQRYRPQPFRR
jgi:hypothetical protein